METRDLLVLMGFLRGGRMFPVAVPAPRLPAKRSLRILYETIAAEERGLRGPLRALAAADAEPGLGPSDLEAPESRYADTADVRSRSAVTDWSGELLAWNLPVGEVRDPGVVLCLMYEGPAADAALPIDVFAQTLRRYALRDPAMRARFEAHVGEHGTFVPPWLAPEVRAQRSQEAFERAMKVAREQGFAAAAPLFEGVRGARYAEAQIALAVHELRDLEDAESALGRLDEVLRVAPRNVAARMQRAQVLVGDPSRRVEAASDWLAVLRELGQPDGERPPPELCARAREGLWALHREFGNPKKLEAAAALVKREPDRGFEAVSRYVHTHPCAWDAQILLASLSLARQGFELAARLLRDVRWILPDDPNPHFVYAQAQASKGHLDEALRALTESARLAPGDPDIARWLAFAQERRASASVVAEASFVKVAHHVVRTLLLLVGFVRAGRVFPAALALHRVPGDVSLALVVQALAIQERRRFGPGDRPAPLSGAAPFEARAADDDELDLRTVADRTVLLERSGARLHVEQLVGDVRDPGVVVALLYGAVERDGAGRLVHAPPADECHRTLTSLAQTDTELAGKLARHLESPDATLLARLEIAG
jgi:tetratricopeptide (TPR) repeat protein